MHCPPPAHGHGREPHAGHEGAQVGRPSPQRGAGAHIVGTGSVNAGGKRPEPRLAGSVAHAPTERVEDMAFHLVECRGLVNVVAVTLQIGWAGQILVRILVLGRDEQSSTPNERVMASTDDAFRCITVQDVYCEKEGFMLESVDSVQVGDKLDERVAHLECDVGLLLHRSATRLSEMLQKM